MQYLLDSNICIYFLRNKQKVVERLAEVGWDNCYISEYSVAELYYGAECSDCAEENLKDVADFCSAIHVIPISGAIREFARQKSFLRRSGTMIEDADIFIGATAIVNGMVMVTENVRHLARLQGISIENWLEL